MRPLQVVPIPFAAAGFILLGVGMLFWLWVIVDVARLLIRQRRGEDTGFTWNPVTEESEPKTFKTQQHIYGQAFFVGLFFFVFGIVALIYTGIIPL